MKTIALFNIKGGVGKTTSAVNLAYLAAHSGMRTTLWDLDPQGCAGWYLGIDDADLERRAAKLIEGKLSAQELLMPTKHANLSVVPSDLSARKLDVLLAEQDAGKNHFKSLLKSLEGEQDLVILDCAPALSNAAEQIFNAVDLLLVPLIPSPLSLRAYEQLKEFTAQKKWSHLKLVPFFTQVDRRRKIQNEIIENRKKRFPESLKTFIPYASALEQMGIHRAPITVFASSSASGLGYWLLWAEVKRMLKSL
ncbi:MAG TPA: AAA family ATPase [Spongiibacteraceae bacterium]